MERGQALECKILPFDMTDLKDYVDERNIIHHHLTGKPTQDTIYLTAISPQIAYVLALIRKYVLHIYNLLASMPE